MVNFLKEITMAYSQDLRQRILDFILQGGGRTEASKLSIGIQNFPPIGVQFFPLFSLVERGFYDA